MPTPEEPGQPHERQVLEPIRVLRPRNTDALAELIREMTEPARDAGSYEAIPLPRERTGGEAETEELPPVRPRAATATAPRGGSDWASERGGRRPGSAPVGGGRTAPDARPGARGTKRTTRERGGSAAAPAAGGARARARADSDAGLRRGAITVGVCAAALLGFACALLLPGRGGEAAAETAPPTAVAPPSAAPSAAATASADPDGAGTLREGDSGPEVSDLQRRLLRIPNVYENGPTDGRYDTVLTEAVARFQLWYGIRGDESGVYGDDTRRDLESRTASHTG
ncbi:peptidoglycan-binding domain-containing protein [Streptomyces scabiei]|uniref:peptidoglycan-binding domain-containing protein n=2 Tax=Streptomyces TaxID=1883 RepID=UPI0029AE0E43|nr:peptidoglycan-binding domain-containing protein [Streptomyces scabiei]MDX3114292.1 peptidoglycan-binding domain-containing protein [Streptomyces scabiei]